MTSNHHIGQQLNGGINQMSLNSNKSQTPEKLATNHYSHKTPPKFSKCGTASKSEPNLKDIESTPSPSDDIPSASLSGTAYTYTTSAITGAYSYMTSFYASPQAVTNGNNNVNYNNVEFQSHSLSDLKSQSINNNNNNNHKNGNYLSNSSNEDASIPDFDKYPLRENESNLGETLALIERDGLNNNWTKIVDEPVSDTVKLRSNSYLRDAQKEYGAKGETPIFRLAYAQAFKTDNIEDHIALHSCSWFKQNIHHNDMSCFTIIIHLQIRSIRTSFISYHVLEGDKLGGFNKNGTPIVKGDKAVTKLLDIVLNCNDSNILNNKWKLIPRIVSGPYPVKKVVENRPVLLGNKVPLNYYRGTNYFEIDAKVDDTMVASSIIKLCHRFAKRIVVDLSWTLQGDDACELPERLLCGLTIHNMNFDECKDVEWEQNNCKKLIYKKKNKNKNINNNNNNYHNHLQYRQYEQKENK